MIRILIEDLKPGMKLAQSIENENGVVLIPEGTQLTSSHIDRLIKMGIISVLIEGKKPPKKTKEELLTEVERRFKKTEHEQFVAMLKTVLIEHIDSLYERNET
ncbi:MAG: hypothetical protein N3A59_00635 [Thermodesulfovibrionales bacterium]|nr:hypothetical protein [Thermodesulfovibrionales bacterium]